MFPSPANSVLVPKAETASSPSLILNNNWFHLSSTPGIASPLTEFPVIQKLTGPDSAAGAIHLIVHVLSAFTADASV